MSVTILVGDVLEKLATLKDESVHCVVTSPPYWGLRDYGVEGQLGLEATVEEYVEKMVAVFREVRRVLRKDGTLWLNMGDCYSGAGPSGAAYQSATTKRRATLKVDRNFRISKRLAERGLDYSKKKPTPVKGLKPKDLVGQPWRIAFALQADGWYLRSDIIWYKLNPMPESCRDRPTKAHEYIFMFTKAARYFWDQEAVREGEQVYTRKAGGYKNHHKQGASSFGGKGGFSTSDVTTVGRNMRSVWTIPTQPFPQAHFATFPEELPRRCIAAGTSEKGCCPKCGAPWLRVVEKKTRGESWHDHKDDRKQGQREESNDYKGANYYKNTRPPKTTGWKPGCKHKTKPIPCTVLDPFSGAGTTGLVAVKMGRNYVGIELNPEYAKMAENRIYNAVPLLIGD
jgi:DNA modification methylase